MPADLEFTGERFLPGLVGEIVYEHGHRYAFARRFAAGRRVLDAACGEGYGSALLGDVAAAVTGIDIDPATVAHARAAYAGRPNLRFVDGSVTSLPLSDASVDLVVSFETIEHLDAADQPRMLAEFARVLAPGGLVVLSSPNRPQYSEARNYANPFHRHELDREELARLVEAELPASRWYRQRLWFGSVLWSEAEGAREGEAIDGDGQTAARAMLPEALYFVVVAARTVAELPAPEPGLSLFSDAQCSELVRRDTLLTERLAALDRQTYHIRHLEELVAYRDKIVLERDRQLQETQAAHERERGEFRTALAGAEQALKGAQAALLDKELTLAGLEGSLGLVRRDAGSLDQERLRLERAVEAQERIITYRQSFRWWLQLPWLRLRHWISRIVQ